MCSYSALRGSLGKRGCWLPGLLLAQPRTNGEALKTLKKRKLCVTLFFVKYFLGSYPLDGVKFLGWREFYCLSLHNPTRYHLRIHIATLRTAPC